MRSKEAKHMVVKRLTLENLGHLGNRSFDFCSSLNVITGANCNVILAALSAAVRNVYVHVGFPQSFLAEGSHIRAEIEADGIEYVSETACGSDESERAETKVYCGGREVTAEELSAVFNISHEEEESSYFAALGSLSKNNISFKKSGFAKKIAEYKNEASGKNRREFEARTDGIGLTDTFRRELNEYCVGFLSKEIVSAKPIRLAMDADGAFVAESGWAHCNVDRSRLAAADGVLFDYFCFLEINRFWGAVRRMTGGTVPKPLFVGSDLADMTDIGTDLSPVMRETLALGRQTFLFTEFASKKNVEKRFQSFGKYKVVVAAADIS